MSNSYDRFSNILEEESAQYFFLEGKSYFQALQPPKYCKWWQIYNYQTMCGLEIRVVCYCKSGHRQCHFHNSRAGERAGLIILIHHSERRASELIQRLRGNCRYFCLRGRIISDAIECSYQRESWIWSRVE